MEIQSLVRGLASFRERLEFTAPLHQWTIRQQLWGKGGMVERLWTVKEAVMIQQCK
jgi:hypothetical protein